MDRDGLSQRLKAFAHRCVKLSAALPDSALGKHIRSQLIRCSTSAPANYRAACIAQSRAGFVAKLSIAVEETDESCFWLEFIIDEKLLPQKNVQPLFKESRELTAILVASRKTTRRNSK
jgi:four helix bundle protein